LHLPHNPNSKSIAYRKWPVHIAPEDRVLFTEPMLYNLENDIGETTNVASENPAVVEELTKLLNWVKKDIGDFEKRGENARPLGDEPYFTPNDLIPAKE
jgi:arylsulfatase